MKEFKSAVEEIEFDAEREKKIAELVEGGMSHDDAVAETEPHVEFKVDDRVLRAYQPTGGQLAFLLATLGRGQTGESRFASIINIMLSCLRDEDKDYMESRLLTRDPKTRLPVEQIEAIFEYLVGEWFGRPTEPQSDSAG